MSFRVILVTTPLEKADVIAEHLLQKKLCACVNIIEKAKSKYWWKGKIETVEEAILMIKSKVEFIERLLEEILGIHPYDVPEILSLEVKEGSESYLKWISSSLFG